MFKGKKTNVPTMWRIYENGIPVATAENIQAAYYRMKAVIAEKASQNLKDYLLATLETSYAAQIQRGSKADNLNSGTFHAKKVKAG